MAIHADSHPADSFSHQAAGLKQESYAAAVEQGLPTPENEHSIVNLEAAVKETPPRVPSGVFNGHIRSDSEPRALDEVMDEDERSSSPLRSPSLRHPKGRLENSIPSKRSGDSYADVIKEEPTSPHLLAQTSTGDGEKDGHTSPLVPSTKGSAAPDSYTGIGSDESPRSPFRKAHKRVSSRSLNSNASKALQQALNETDTVPQYDGAVDENDVDKGLVFENYHSRSGTNLASIQPGGGYDLALSQKEDKDISSSRKGSQQTTRRRRDSTLVSGRRAGEGWARSAIRWAPLNVPLQRRLQTLMVLAHSLSIAAALAFFFLLCTIPLLWPILVPYLVYVLLSRAATDGKLAHRSEWLRRSRIWSLFASYFPARLHRTVPLEPNRKYIFGYHPHGIISHGAIAAFATEALGFGQLFPGITNTLLTLDSNFRIPLYRDYALRLGLNSVSRESCQNLLSRGGPNGEGMGRAITIVIGGARESLDAKPGSLNLVLAKRKGFVKLAVRTGADLVPVLGFGENDLYEQVDATTHPWIHKAQLGVKKFMGFTVPLFHARGVFNYDVGVMPYRRPINIVVGRPIQVLQSKSPSPEYVDKLHKEYTDELYHMWNEWKDSFAQQRKSELEIIE